MNEPRHASGGDPHDAAEHDEVARDADAGRRARDTGDAGTGDPESGRRPAGEAPSPAGEASLGDTGLADNAERVPHPESEPAEAGEAATEQVERLEGHHRPVTEPEEPAASRRDPGVAPPRT